MSEAEAFDYTTVERELENNGVYASVTRGNSMEPLFKTHRDVVIVKRIDCELKPYDVALYRGNDGNYILHRVLKVKDDYYVIRGDNTFAKEYVPKCEVVGVLISFNRKGKEHSVSEFGYKLYSRLWRFIYPIRCIKRFLRRLAGRVYRFFFPRKRKGVGNDRGK